MMRGKQFVLALFAGLSPISALAESGAYVPYAGIVRGTEGVTPVAVQIRNQSNTAITCQAALAHWYSADLGQIAPEVALTVTLWQNPETGQFNLLNKDRDRMPVEALWCAPENDPTEVRTRLDLPIHAGPAAPNLSFACRTQADGGMACKAATG